MMENPDMQQEVRAGLGQIHLDCTVSGLLAYRLLVWVEGVR
jgi:hypothetical protein